VICATVALSMLAREHGAGARAEFRRQLAEPDETSLPCVRTLRRLRELDQGVQLFPDFTDASPATLRSRAAHMAYKSGARVWVSCDEDVEAPGDTVRDLVEAVDVDEPAICVAPCIVRGRFGEFPDVVDVGLDVAFVTKVRTLPSGGQAIPCLAGGMGLAAVNRAALERVREAHPELVVADDEGMELAVLFVDMLEGKRWWRDALAFFRRVPEGVRVECLLQGATSRAGAVFDARTVPEARRLALKDWAIERVGVVAVDVTVPAPPPAAGDVGPELVAGDAAPPLLPASSPPPAPADPAEVERALRLFGEQPN